jgi:hypothetical protein
MKRREQEALELLMDAWCQFSIEIRRPDKRFKGGWRVDRDAGALSTLEDIRDFLTGLKLLDCYGRPRPSGVERLRKRDIHTLLSECAVS